MMLSNPKLMPKRAYTRKWAIVFLIPLTLFIVIWAGYTLFISNENYEGYVKKGKTNANNGEHPYALEAYKKALEYRPDGAEALTGLGWVFIRLQAYDQADSLLNVAIQKHPKYLEAYMALAECFRLQGDFTTAIDVCRKAYEAIPDSVEPYLTAGELYLSAGQSGQAVDMLERALTVSPNNAEVLNKLNSAKRTNEREEEVSRRASIQSFSSGTEHISTGFSEGQDIEPYSNEYDGE